MIEGARRTLTTLIAALAALGSCLLLAGAAPEPNPASQRWELQIEPGPLRIASVEAGDVTGLYYYFTYTVTNRSGQTILFAPMFTLATDDGGSRVAGDGVTSEVTRELLSRLNNPLLEDQLGIIGPLQQGPENARQGLVIWPLTRADADEVKVFCAGFSGETARLSITDPVSGDPKTVTLRKTLMLRYSTPGDLTAGPQRLNLVDQRWVMR